MKNTLRWVPGTVITVIGGVIVFVVGNWVVEGPGYLNHLRDVWFPATESTTAAQMTFAEGMQAYRNGDYDTAYRAFQGLAAEGDRRAQASLGDMYRKGYGVALDHTEAMQWYLLSADQGNAHAQQSLGWMYRDGLGVPHDAECAYMWFDLAARTFPASSDRRVQAAEHRNRTAASLDSQDVKQAGRLAARWQPGERFGCPVPAAPTGFNFLQYGPWMPITIIGILLVLLYVFFLRRSPSRRRQEKPEVIRTPASGSDVRPMPPDIGSIIAGEAYVIDGDTLMVSDCRIRIAGLDAPELNQPAEDRNGRNIDDGLRVKNKLIEAIGGSHVQIKVEGYDRYDRVIGAVTCDDKDVGEWLVRSGHAVAAYDDRYRQVEAEARRKQRGLWSHRENWHPEDWRYATRERD